MSQRRRRSRRALLACLGLATLGACDAGAYTVEVGFDPPELSADAVRVEVAVVASCDAQTAGEAPVGAVAQVEVRRMERAEPLGDVAPGSYGLYGRAIGGDCGVVAAGCAEITLTRGGSGALRVDLSAVAGALCPAAECVDGECTGSGDGGPSDAGPEDGGPEADAGPPTDAGDVDAGGCECDDGDPCTTDGCDESGACITTAAPDGTACDAGQCREGACCAGCWDGTQCAAGDAAAACGLGGGLCETCACPSLACSSGGECVAGVARAIGAGRFHTCAVLSPGGEIACTGDNVFGQLGLGDAGPGTHRQSFTVVTAAGAGWDAVDGGFNHTCALRGTTISCWGNNGSGQLGNGTNVDRLMPVAISGAFETLDVKANNACAFDTAGGLHCWGDNRYGQLGVGDVASRNVPTPVMVPAAETGWTRVSVGNEHACAIAASGALYCWGHNDEGQLGVGLPIMSGANPLPLLVGSGTEDWIAVASGEGNTCAITGTNEMFCWGADHDGQMGSGTASGLEYNTPQPFSRADTWTRVFFGEDHGCAANAVAELYCWGENDFGSVGDGTSTADHATPAAVVNPPNSWGAVTTGEDHVCALRTSGELACWGANHGTTTGHVDSGQLGLGDAIDRSAPTEVCLP